MNVPATLKSVIARGLYPADTSREAWELQCEIWGRMSAQDKLNQVIELNEQVRQLALAGARQRMPNASLAEIQSEVARQMLGDELWQAVYGNCREETG